MKKTAFSNSGMAEEIIKRQNFVLSIEEFCQTPAKYFQGVWKYRGFAYLVIDSRTETSV